jgi:hypothetical protein
MSKMASHEPFGHLQPKLWAKEGPRVKLTIWLPTTKSQESTSSRRLQQECDMALKSSWQELQLWFKPRPDLSLGREIMYAQSPRSPNRDNFGTVSGLHFGSLGKKSHLDVTSARSCKKYYKGEGGGFPQVWAVVNQVNPSCPWLVPTPKKVQNEF